HHALHGALLCFAWPNAAVRYRVPSRCLAAMHRSPAEIWGDLRTGSPCHPTRSQTLVGLPPPYRSGAAPEMDFTSRYPITPLTVLAQDPSIVVNGQALTITVPVPSASLAPGPKGPRIQVIDYDSTEGRYYAPYPQRPGTPFDRYANVASSARLVA